jgi:ribosomal protein S18 acetylase RimI-like enzyme
MKRPRLAEYQKQSFNLRDGRQANLRSARPSDASATLNLYRSVVEEGQYTLLQPDELKRGQPQEEDNIRGEKLVAHKLRLVAEVDEEVVGMARVSGGELMRTEHFGEIDSVWVRAEMRGQGIGRALMSALEGWARAETQLEKLGLYVFSTNTRAIQLYTGMGYEIEGRGPKDIKFGPDRYADTIVMGKLLK